ncbi:MAG TPA: alpha/beta fold hydrolase [Stellaceae bacterium]
MQRLRRSGTWGGIIAGFLMLSACAPTRLDAAVDAQTDPGVAPRFTTHDFITADGRTLPLREWLPSGRPKAVILGLHGFNDYSHAFAAPAAVWARQGIATYAYDQRGFGAAPGRGRWPGGAVLAADAAAASRVLRSLYPHVSLYLLGESMGGAVAIVAATGAEGTPAPDVDGVILAAPAVWGRATMDFLPRAALWVAVRLVPGMELTGRGLHRMPSDNIEMLRALARDPMVIKETRVDTIWGLVNLMDAALAAAPRLRVPLLVMYGAHDEIVPKVATRRFVRSLPIDPGDRRRLAFYTHGYHMLLRDLEGPLVAADVAGWVLHPNAPLLSGADHGGAEASLAGPAPARPNGG